MREFECFVGSLFLSARLDEGLLSFFLSLLIVCVVFGLFWVCRGEVAGYVLGGMGLVEKWIWDLLGFF